MEHDIFLHIHARNHLIQKLCLVDQILSGTSIKCVLHCYLFARLALVDQIGLEHDILWQLDKGLEALVERKQLACIHKLANRILDPRLLLARITIQLREVMQHGHTGNLILDIALLNLLIQTVKDTTWNLCIFD